MSLNNNHITRGSWQGKISNNHQLGGIETAIQNNGNANGVRVAWINNGSGIRFKVILDRGMDISDFFFNQYSIAWLSHMGVKPPDYSANKGYKWLDSFCGGMVTTCGLTHVGGPEDDNYGIRGLHDRINHSPAQLQSIKQPDLRNNDLQMSITGKMIQSTVFGPHLEMVRKISTSLGSTVVKIYDIITNIGNETTPHMLLYHCNFGWPLIDDGVEIFWEGDLYVPNKQSQKIFQKNNNYKHCRNPIDDHRGNGESVAFIDITPKDNGICNCGVFNPNIGLKCELKFQKKQLRWLTNWQHWGENEYIMALEPGTHPPIGQSAARKNKSLIYLQPGESKSYNLEIVIYKN